MKIKSKLSKIIFIIYLILLFILVGCGNKEITIEMLTESRVLVTYDGNGGYLGNKSSTTRKLYAAVGSVIPNYLTEYTNSQYVTNGLGLAMKDGYNLNGWYIDDEEHVTYVADPTQKGQYIYLSGNNGIYKVDNENGIFVFKYVSEGYEDTGSYVLLNVEQPTDGTEVSTKQYIFLDGEFKIFDNENAKHIESKEQNGLFAGASLSISGYVKHDSISDDKLLEFINTNVGENNEKTFKRYEGVYAQFDSTVDDEDSTRYAFTSGYAKIDVMMEVNPNGAFVLVGDNFERYDESGAYDGYERYSINPTYVFTEPDSSPSNLPRFNAEITYWNFENNRITEDMRENGIVLKADWQKKLTVYFVYEDVDNLYPEDVTKIIDDYKYDNNGNVRKFLTQVSLTTKMNETGTASITLKIGDTLTKPGRPVAYPNYTFIGWSKSADEYIPWDFANDVIPDGTTELYIYAYEIQGSYTLIYTKEDLAKIANNPNGNYLVMNDIDLEGTAFTSKTPLGFKINNSTKNTVFTGSLIGYGDGVKISNYKLVAQNAIISGKADTQKETSHALIPFAYGAKVSNISLEDVIVEVNPSGTDKQVVGAISASAMIGRTLSEVEAKESSNYDVTGTIAENKKTIIENCYVNIKFTRANDKPLTKTLTIGDFIAKGKDFCIFDGCTSVYDVADLSGDETINCFVN